MLGFGVQGLGFRQAHSHRVRLLVKGFVLSILSHPNSPDESSWVAGFAFLKPALEDG